MNAERLEQNALAERDRIEKGVRELIDKVAHASPVYKLNEHFVRVSTAAAIVLFLFGFAIGSIAGRR